MWPRRADTPVCLALALALAVVVVGCRKRDTTDEPAEPVKTPPVKILYPTTPGSFVKLVDRLKPSVVHIYTDVKVKGGPADWFPSGKAPQDALLTDLAEKLLHCLGTGFIIDVEGYVFTNHHIVTKAKELHVKLHDGTKMRAKLVGEDAKTDIALLKLEVPPDVNLKAVRLGDSEQLQPGEWVFALGNPFGMGVTVSAGVVSSKENAGGLMAQVGYWGFFQTDVSINPGNSGGPVCNTVGEVVGIATAVDVDAGGIGFAVPINLALKLRPMLAKDGRVTRAYVGIYGVKVTDEKAKELGLSEAKGALVAGVIPRAPAEQAGLRVGDVILRYDRKPVTRAEELPWMTSMSGVNRMVEVEVWRDGKKLKFTLKTATMPQ
jgi:serine protease Do